MRLHAIWLASAAIVALLGAYYAGYRQGVQRRFVSIPAAGVPAGESDRTIGHVRETAPRPSALNSISKEDYETLLGRDLTLPLSGVKTSQIVDTFDQSRGGGRRHEATDIMAERGTAIHAVQDGTIRKLFFSKAGGNTIYEFDPDGVYCFYYAHLDRYADALHEGMTVKKGDVIGYVGSTGDASKEAPHLHFGIMKLGPDKKWWEGSAINPYPVLVQLASR